MTETKKGIPPGYKIEAYYEKNPWTNARYRRERLVPIVDINQPPEEPPADPSLMTKEEYEQFRLKGQLVLPGLEK